MVFIDLVIFYPVFHDFLLSFAIFCYMQSWYSFIVKFLVILS